MINVILFTVITITVKVCNFCNYSLSITLQTNKKQCVICNLNIYEPYRTKKLKITNFCHFSLFFIEGGENVFMHMCNKKTLKNTLSAILAVIFGKLLRWN